MKKLTVLVIMVSLLVFGSSYAFAWAPQVQGVPYEFRPGDSRGVFVWRDGDGFHVRTTTRGQGHVFSGVIRTDGQFRNVRDAGGEGRDFHRLNLPRDMISFRFETKGGVDGFDFRVKGGERLMLDLFMDGHRIATREIYVGRRGWHPASSDFTLRR
jgi:hypothetical protein